LKFGLSDCIGIAEYQISQFCLTLATPGQCSFCRDESIVMVTQRCYEVFFFSIRPLLQIEQRTSYILILADQIAARLATNDQQQRNCQLFMQVPDR
jgi:hypothetical protein